MSATREYETVKVQSDGGVATVRLARPDTLNAWNKQFGLDMLEALTAVSEDADVRAVVLRGEGRGFSSGADLKDMSERETTPDGRPDVYRRLTEIYHPLFVAIRQMPKPVVAAVHGPAVGIGLGLAMCCDLVVAREDAYFLLAFVNIGLVPDGGSSLFIPRRIGFTRAMEMAMLGERVPAAQALEWGLINRVWSEADFDGEVDALATRLAAGPTMSYAGSKRQLNNSMYSMMDEQLELEAGIQREMAGSEDFVEGVMAFLQKRPTSFSGK